MTIDVDALWAEMLAGKPAARTEKPLEDDTAAQDVEVETKPEPSQDDTVRIKRTYNFAGRVHTEEKVVARDSAEAKLYFASKGSDDTTAAEAPSKRTTKKAFRSIFEPLHDPQPQRADLDLGVTARAQAGQEARKLNTVEKSRMDWAGYVDKEGIKDDLQAAGRSKDSYNVREDFLARSEARREQDARQARVTGRT